MHATLERIRSNPIFRPAIAAPIVLALLFSFFNLTAPPDQSRIPAAVRLAVVNLDAGVPLVPVKLSERLLAAMESRFPFEIRELPDEAAARAAIADGEVAAALVLPPDFTLKAMGKDPVTVRVINTQHLSLAETQLGGFIADQLQLAMSAAISTARLGLAQGVRPAPPAPGEEPAIQLPVTVERETLYAVDSAVALAAPFVMTFATWMAAFVGGLLLFVATRQERGPGSAAPVAVIRTLVPLAVTGLASLALALTVAWAAAEWGAFLLLWLLAWAAMGALALLTLGLFSTFGFWAILVVLPAVFYQPALSGAQAPLAAAPDWLGWIGERVPFDAVPGLYRAVLIGAPEGALWGRLLPVLVAGAIGIALVWLGTFLWHRLVRRPMGTTPAHV